MPLTLTFFQPFLGRVGQCDAGAGCGTAHEPTRYQGNREQNRPGHGHCGHRTLGVESAGDTDDYD